MESFKEKLQEVWTHPVWSKVIAYFIILLLGTISTVFKFSVTIKNQNNITIITLSFWQVALLGLTICVIIGYCFYWIALRRNSFLCRPIFGKDESETIINKTYNKILKGLTKNCGETYSIYDFNLQTNPIGDQKKRIADRIFKPDPNFVKNIMKCTNVRYYVLYATNSRKQHVVSDDGTNTELEYINSWKNITGFEESTYRKLIRIRTTEKEYPIPNIFLVPELNFLYIGMDNYECWPEEKSIDKIIGGGILIKDKRICQPFKRLCEEIMDIQER